MFYTSILKPFLFITTHLMKCILYCDQVYTHTHTFYTFITIIFLKYHKAYQGAMQNTLIFKIYFTLLYLKKFVSTHQISLDHTC